MLKKRMKPVEVVRIKRRRPTYEPPRPGVTRVSGLRLSDPDYHKEKAEAEAAASELTRISQELGLD